MAIELKQTALDSLLSNAPGQIFQMMQMKQAYDQNERQTQAYLAANYMDRGGYGQAVDEWFNNFVLNPGTLEVGENGQWLWKGPAGSKPGEYNMLSETEAWAKYVEMVGSDKITPGDSRYFKEKLWPEIIQKRGTLYAAELDKLRNTGYSERDIKNIMIDNPNMLASFGKMMPYADANTRQLLASVMPQKPVNVLERVASATPVAGAVGGGAYAASSYMDKTPSQEVLDKAKDKFNKHLEKNKINPETRTSEKLTKAEQKLEQAKKRKASKDPKTKSYKDKQTRIKNARKEVTAEKSRVTRNVNKAKDIRDKYKTKNTRWKQFKGRMPAPGLNFFTAAIAPWAGKTVGGYIGGEGGEAVGRSAGGATQIAYGGLKAKSFWQFLKHTFPKIATKKGAQVAAAAMADSPAPGPMDALAAAWGLGSGSYEMYQAWKQWNRSSANPYNFGGSGNAPGGNLALMAPQSSTND